MAETVLKIIDVGIAIKKAIDTTRSNHRECEAIGKVADQVCGLLRLLHPSAELAVRHPAVAGVLGSVLESMEKALQLVISCGEKNIVVQLITAQSTAKKLAKVQREILEKISLGTLAVTVATAVNLSRPQPLLGGLDCPYPCTSVPELLGHLGGIYRGEIGFISVLVTDSTRATMTLAMRAAGADSIFLTGENWLIAFKFDFLNGGEPVERLKIIYGTALQLGLEMSSCEIGSPDWLYYTCEELGFSLTAEQNLSLFQHSERLRSEWLHITGRELLDLQRPTLYESSHALRSPQISELTAEEDAATNLVHQPLEPEEQVLALRRLGELALEGAVIACHTKDELDAQLAKGNEAGKLVVINFMSPTCGPSPVFADCAKEYPTAAVFLEVDIHELEQAATIFNIQRTPTFAFVRQGLTLETFVGTHNPAKLRNTIKEFIDDNTPADDASASSST